MNSRVAAKVGFCGSGHILAAQEACRGLDRGVVSLVLRQLQFASASLKWHQTALTRLDHLAGPSYEDFNCWHKGGEAITFSGLFFWWIGRFHLQTFFIKLVELCGYTTELGFQLWLWPCCVGCPGIKELWALLCGGETQKAHCLLEAVWLPNCRRSSSAVLCSGFLSF